MTARIFKPARNAMQSGTATTREWMLVHEPTRPRDIDPLMGWTGSYDTRQQVKLAFDSKEEAIAYAERNGLAYSVVEEPPRRKPASRSYSDNFRFGRIGVWTH